MFFREYNPGEIKLQNLLYFPSFYKAKQYSKLLAQKGDYLCGVQNLIPL